MSKITLKNAIGPYGDVSQYIDFFSLIPDSGPTATKAVAEDAFGATVTYLGTGFKFQGGEATRGTVTGVEFRDVDGHLLETVTNCSFSLKSLYTADYFTTQQILQSGNDTINGTDMADVLLVGGNPGNDKIYGKGGDDYINGSAGDNQMDGGAGRDVLNFENASVGGSNGAIINAQTGEVQNPWGGTDTIDNFEIFFGTFMKDVMKGSNANEVFNGMGGNDRLTGGKGADRFHFADFSGKDTITDFGNGNDIVHLIYNGVDSFDDLSITYKNGNAIITLDDDSILTLLHVDKGSLHANDFDFSWE